MHAIGGLCGFFGTHPIGNVALATEGIQSSVYPGIIDNCHVTVKMSIPGATHVGGLVGTGRLLSFCFLSLLFCSQFPAPGILIKAKHHVEAAIVLVRLMPLLDKDFSYNN